MIKPKQLIVIILLVGSIISCKKDKENETLSKDTISAKWLVTGSNSDYESFEFNQSGNYIVVRNSATKSTAAQIILFGTYQIVDNVTIELSSLGKIKITSIEKSNFSFSLTLQYDQNNQILIVATKASEFSSSTRTQLLCRTWKIVTIDGVNVEGTEDGGSILFSAAGTYLVTWVGGENGLAQWTWKDSKETTMCYSWEGDPTCNGDNEVQIIELTQNSMKISEKYNGKTIIYVLVPTSSTKSAQFQSIPINTEKSIKKGLLSR
jgi:hypothetical protein